VLVNKFIIERILACRRSQESLLIDISTYYSIVINQNISLVGLTDPKGGYHLIFSGEGSYLLSGDGYLGMAITRE